MIWFAVQMVTGDALPVGKSGNHLANKQSFDNNQLS